MQHALIPHRTWQSAARASRLGIAISMGMIALLTCARAVAAAVPDDGVRVYEASCVACHQQGGTGIPGAFPPLVKQVPALLTQPDGRDYLIKVTLFGLEGRIRVGDADFQGVMPPWGALSDGDIAAVLNHVSSAWGNQTLRPAEFRPFAANEVKALRQQALTAAAVHATRPGGAAAGPGQTAATASMTVSFTAEQAARGKGIYTRRCVDCHGSTLDNGEFGGAPLNGTYFKEHWGAGSVAGLIAYTRAKMPPDAPGSLSDQSYVDVVAYLLEANDYPHGDKELPADPELQQAISLKPRL